jgi:bud site selection protein 31
MPKVATQKSKKTPKGWD